MDHDQVAVLLGVVVVLSNTLAAYVNWRIHRRTRREISRLVKASKPRLPPSSAAAAPPPGGSAP